MLQIKPDRRVRKALTLLVLTLGLTAGSFTTSVAPSAEARWVRRCYRVHKHHHWVRHCRRVRVGHRRNMPPPDYR